MLKIYITNLAGYNSSHLIGEFITLPMKSIATLTNSIEK